MTTAGRLLTSAILAAAATACASTPDWYWQNVVQPNRSLELDGYSCDQRARAASEGLEPMQRFVQHSMTLEACMFDLGWRKVEAGTGPTPLPAAAGQNLPAPSRVLLFGGQQHGTYLGCVSCASTDPESVFNPVGIYGSTVSPTSIFNKVGQYGSPVSPYSVCNPVASEPPVLVNEEGTVLGRLTLNSVLPGATTDQRVMEWLAGMCRS